MKTLDEMNLIEKKAAAYDIIAQLENLNRQLQIINQSIQKEFGSPKN